MDRDEVLEKIKEAHAAVQQFVSERQIKMASEKIIDGKEILLAVAKRIEDSRIQVAAAELLKASFTLGPPGRLCACCNGSGRE